MKYVVSEQYSIYPGRLGAKAPVIYVIDMPEHPFNVKCVADERDATVVTAPIARWDDSLTPWPAPGLYEGDADFKGEADVTMSELLGQAIPAIERAERLEPAKRAICGYSLGGLFALYAFTHSGFFDACACLSGSVWYEGWIEHLRGLDFDVSGKFAFFSIGSKEKKANPEILHCVEDNMAECAEICRAHGAEAEFEVGPGNHIQHHEERFKRGLDALNSHLSMRH